MSASKGLNTARSNLAVVCAALALLAPAAAWSQAPQSWASIVAAAKKEGRVVLYAGPTQPVAERIAAGFKKAYPDIAVDINRGASGALLAKVDQERNSGADGADVLISTEAAWYTARAKEGKLLKPAGPAVAGWPAKFLEQGSIVGVGIQFQGIGYNKKLTSNPPKTYADLLKPEFKGKVGISTLASSFLVGWYDWLEKNQGPDYLTKMKAQNPKIYVGSAPAAQALASGEIAVALMVTFPPINALVGDGAPIAFVVPPAAMGQSFRMSALSWSKRPNAALVFVDYLMSREGQTAWHAGETSSPLPNIPGAVQLPPNVVLWNADDWPPEAVAKYRERWDKVFK